MDSSNKGTLNRKEAAAYLGISLPMLYGFLRRELNPIPAIRCGRKWLIPAASLERWLQEESERTTNEKG